MCKIKLTKQQLEVIIHHLKIDLHFGSGGSFISKNLSSDDPDFRDIGIAERAVKKLEQILILTK